MSPTTFSYRWFGNGKFPPKEVMGTEQPLLAEEGLGGSLIRKKFRSPNKITNWSKTGLTASVVITHDRLLIFTNNKPMVNIGWDDERLSKIRITTGRNHELLMLEWDVSLFLTNCSGTMELRIRTDMSRDYIDKIEMQKQKTSPRE